MIYTKLISLCFVSTLLSIAIKTSCSDYRKCEKFHKIKNNCGKNVK